jgi:hypothetical protein
MSSLMNRGVTTDLLRRYGRSPRGVRLRDYTPYGGWQTHTVVAALRVDALTAPAVFNAPIDNPGFLAYVEQVLVPTLRPGDVVVLDNLATSLNFDFRVTAPDAEQSTSNCQAIGGAYAMTAVPIDASDAFAAGSPTRLVAPGVISTNRMYAVTKDGQRFLVNARPENAATAAPLTVIVNWTSTLRK